MMPPIITEEVLRILNTPLWGDDLATRTMEASRQATLVSQIQLQQRMMEAAVQQA